MQTWKSLDVPKEWIECTISLQQSLIGTKWKYIFITDDEMYAFVQHKFPHLLNKVKQLPYGVQRADVLRYLWLYAYGGIYIDMDYKIQKSFVKYIESLDVPLCVLHSSNMPLCITNSFIVAKKGLSFLYDLACKSLNNPHGSWWSISKHIEIMTSTGPLAFHLAVKKSSLSYVVLPNDLFLPSSPELDESTTNENAYMVPVKGASWNSYDSVILNAINYNKFSLIFIVVLFVVLKLLDSFLLRKGMNDLLKRINSQLLKDKLQKILDQ
jgi:mannosyltransferase OCH1-like enzyme